MATRGVVQQTREPQPEVRLSAYQPLLITLTLQCSCHLILLWIIVKLNAHEMGVAVFENMTIRIATFCVFESWIATLDSMESDTYNVKLNGIRGLHARRVHIMTLVCSIPLGVAWLSLPWMVCYLIPDSELVLIAGQYMHFYAIWIGASGWGLSEAAKTHVQVKGEFGSSAWVALAYTPVHIIFSWWVAFELQMGVRGAICASAFVHALQPLLLISYTIFVAPATTQSQAGMRCERGTLYPERIIHLSILGVITSLLDSLVVKSSGLLGYG